MVQVGYTEVIDHYEVEVANDTKIVQIYYSSNGEKVTLQPGQKGKILKARVMTISNQEMAQMAREEEKKKKVGRPKKYISSKKAAKGKENGDRSDAPGPGSEGGGESA